MKKSVIALCAFIFSVPAFSQELSATAKSRFLAKGNAAKSRLYAALTYSKSLQAFHRGDMEENKLQLALSSAWMKKRKAQLKIAAEIEAKGYEKTDVVEIAEKMLEKIDALAAGVEVRNTTIRELMIKGHDPKTAFEELAKYGQTVNKELKKLVELGEQLDLLIN